MPGQDSTEQYNTIQYITVHDKLRNVIRKMRGSENSKVMRSHNQKKNLRQNFHHISSHGFSDFIHAFGQRVVHLRYVMRSSNTRRQGTQSYTGSQSYKDRKGENIKNGK